MAPDYRQRSGGRRDEFGLARLAPGDGHAADEPDQNELDAKQDVRRLGKTVREKEGEEGETHPQQRITGEAPVAQPAPGQQPGRRDQRKLDEREGEGVARAADNPGLQQPGGQPNSLDRVGLSGADDVVEDHCAPEGRGMARVAASNSPIMGRSLSPSTASRLWPGSTKKAIATIRPAVPGRSHRR